MAIICSRIAFGLGACGRLAGILILCAVNTAPAAQLVADPADLAAQDRVLVPEHQEPGVPGHLTPGQHHQTAEQTANEQVDDREDHSAMIPTRLSARARSSNRAPHGSTWAGTPKSAASPAGYSRSHLVLLNFHFRLSVILNRILGSIS